MSFIDADTDNPEPPVSARPFRDHTAQGALSFLRPCGVRRASAQGAVSSLRSSPHQPLARPSLRSLFRPLREGVANATPAEWFHREWSEDHGQGIV